MDDALAFEGLAAKLSGTTVLQEKWSVLHVLYSLMDDETSKMGAAPQVRQ